MHVSLQIEESQSFTIVLFKRSLFLKVYKTIKNPVYKIFIFIHNSFNQIITCVELLSVDLN